MRFALLGNHVDGLELAGALVASGRHQLLYHAGASDDPAQRRRWPEGVQQVHDLEEVLADPAVEMVLVASSPANRPTHLRRAMQSERHVICVHPADDRPDIVYEVGMIQQDTRQALVPLLPGAFHPAVRRLGEFLSTERSPANETALGEFLLLEVELWSAGEVLLDAGGVGRAACFPGWDVLRALGGEVAEVSVMAPDEEVGPGTPVLLTGRFERRGMFQAALLPNRPEPRWRLCLIGTSGQVELLFPLGVPGPAFLTWRDGTGELHEETWDAWDPWPALVEAIEEALGAVTGRQPAGLSWQDEVRCVELDDAARRSARRRRTTLLEYPEASEEVSFKGTMTLVGCGMLWAIILLVIFSRWVPWLGWVVGPMLGAFLLLQLLRWVIPSREPARGERTPPEDGAPATAPSSGVTQDPPLAREKEHSR